MNVYKDRVQEDLGPHWTNSSSALTSCPDPDSGSGNIRRVSAELITITRRICEYCLTTLAPAFQFRISFFVT